MLKVYNTISGQKEKFKPIKGKKVNFFVCGPTVYDYAHIGHARTYIIFDAIVKYLNQKKYRVFYLQNITDIDDKIINRANRKKIRPKDLALLFEKKYLKDMDALKVNSVTKYARATDFIPEIIKQVRKLLKKGYAYKIKDGIYYDISKFKDYGKISKRTVLQAEDSVSRIDESGEKVNKGDFCLWKFSKPGEPKWLSSFGYGRPGWHIEDTAITEKFFGKQYDVHGGARDLIFPHHEAEIAQMEAISEKAPMVKYWLHTGFLTVNREKMSKSLGNFITVRKFKKDYSARILRYLIIKNHYRSPIDYSEKLISQAKKELEKIDDFVSKLKNISSVKGAEEIKKSASVKNLIEKTAEKFDDSMEDDFNTPKAIAVVFMLLNKGNKSIENNSLNAADAKAFLWFLRKIDKFLNFIFWKSPKKKIPTKIIGLVKKREKCRKEKQWKESDKIRDEIKALGWKVEDTEKGPKLKRV